MKKFNPVEYTRHRWGDQTHTKNHPKQCNEHKYCHIEYEWANDEADPNPVNQSLPNIRLPTPEDDRAAISLEMMTEQNLDDWIAQSLNRSIPSMLNPQKKFYLPQPFENQLRIRYRRKLPPKQYEDETYFQVEKKTKKAASYISNENNKNKPAINELYVDFRQLQPKAMLGTPLKTAKTEEKPTNQIRRRNAILLQNDIHYSRFLKQLKRSTTKPTQQKQPIREQVRPKTQNRQMIYSFNVDSMRRTHCEDDVPNSIIEKEFERIREPQKDFITLNRLNLKQQEQIQQKVRESINEKANNAMLKIDAMTSKKQPPTHKTETNAIIRKHSQLKKPSANANRQTKEVQETDRKLPERVMKLVNNMQVISEHIDEEMSKLDIHLAEVYLKHPSNKIQNKWVLKAQEKIREKEYVLAVDCYKQALILQPDFFIPIYNIAVLLQKQKMLSYAKSWFQLAKEFDTDTDNVSYGLALVQVKQLQFENGLKEIDELITRQETARKKVQMVYYYLRALCYKQLGQFEKARLDYEIIIKNSKPANYHSLSYFLLSVVFAKMRRYTPKFNCLAYINWRETLSLLFYERNKRVREEGMNDNDFADRLIKQPFFCRFSKNLVKKLLTIGRFENIKKESILFIAQTESLIIVNGLVEIWSHQQSITQPHTISVLGQGGTIGAGELDHNLSSRPNYWFLAKTDLEVIRVSRREFSIFWQGQITFEFDYKYNFLKNVGLFKDLPEASLFKLCEAVELKTFEKDWILFNDCSYRHRLLSREGLGFCLGKSDTPDPRFVNSKKTTKMEDILGGRRKVRARFALLIKKHIFKLNEMKFNRLRYPGLFILKEGKIEVEDDRGFRCRDIMSPRDYFGENLLIHSEGFQNYGRMVVSSPTATFYLLNVNKLLWAFTSLDKETMTVNAKERPQIETLRFLKNRFSECLQVKMSKLLSKKD